MELNHVKDNEQNKECMEEKVLCVIRDGKICMRPRWRFICEAVCASIGLFALIFAGVYLVSFIAFNIRSTGMHYAADMGMKGWGTLFTALPWFLILVAILFVICLELLIRRYEFAYRRPVIYSLFGLLIIVSAGSWVITSSSFHSRMAQSVRVEKMAPFVHGFYKTYAEYQPNGVFRGLVRSVATNTIFFVTRAGDEQQVYITPQTIFFSELRPQVNTRIVVFGAPSGTAIEATGVGSLE